MGLTPYQQGRVAHLRCKSVRTNPHESNLGNSKERVDWFNGWYDEWRWSKWGPNEGEAVPVLPSVVGNRNLR